MFLYNLTLQRATGITHAVHGNFSGTKQQEVVVSRGKILELLRPDPNTGKVYVQLTVEVFGVVRALMPFRLTGGTKGNVLSLGLGHGVARRHSNKALHLQSMGLGFTSHLPPRQNCITTLGKLFTPVCLWHQAGLAEKYWQPLAGRWHKKSPKGWLPAH